MSFAWCLKSLREKAGYTQKQLAEKAGITLGDVRNLEQGIHNARWTTVRALADALGVSCEAFTQEPEGVHPPRRGRPPKSMPSSGSGMPPKNPRGRPRKVK
jgi:transcriptional regulator with XRE-family HTH domain